MKKILLLDDNLYIVQVVEEVLSYERFEVKSITGAQSFFDVVELFKPGHIILDFKLSDGTGGELCRKIKMVSSSLCRRSSRDGQDTADDQQAYHLYYLKIESRNLALARYPYFSRS